MSKENSSATTALTLDEFAAATYEAWRKEAEATLDGAPFEKKLVTRTPEGIDIQPIYNKGDLETINHLDALPGQAPYVRGIGTSNHWEVAQNLSAESIEAFNKILRNDLSRGQTVAVINAAEGTGGAVPVKTIDDFDRLLDGVDLDSVPVFLEVGSKALPYFAALVAQLRRQRRSLAPIRGWIDHDPIGQLAATGSLGHSLDHAYSHMALTTGWASRHLPNFGTIAVDTSAYHNAGATAVQEIAYAIATGVEYLRNMEQRGLSVLHTATHTRFTFAIGADFFTAIAKFRVARMLWSKVVAASGGSPDAQKMQIHATTSLYNKSKLDPYVNMLRTTTEAVAAVAGGCQSLNVGPFDEVIRPGDEFSRRIARNTQIILSEECHFDHVIDPAGGSYYVETLTDELAKKAWALFQEIEKVGGMSKALEAGLPQKNVKAAADKKAESMAFRRSSLVGVNVYANPLEKLSATTGKPEAKAEPAVQSKGAEESLLSSISEKTSAISDELMDACIEAAEQGATVNQIAKSLYTGDLSAPTVAPLSIIRAAEPFENLRAAVEAAGTPTVFLANMGPLRQHKARADFSLGFFQAGGFQMIENPGFKTIEAAAEGAAKSGAPIVVICSTDDTYPEIVPGLTKLLKESNPKVQVVLAGYPKDHVESFKQAGVDEFIHIRANCYDTLTNLLAKIGGNN